MPMFARVADAQEDIFFAGQPGGALRPPHLPQDLSLSFTSDEGAGAHCHAGAQRLACARIYDWLDDVLAAPKPVAT
jgi:hypothetical protein